MTKLITAPHPKLRQVSLPIQDIDKRMLRLFRDLEHIMRRQNNPPAVGMALPQLGINLRAFGTLLPNNQGSLSYRLFINPTLIATSKEKSTKNPGSKDDVLEGCFSVPRLYGAVSRPVNAEFSYWTLDKNQKLQEGKQTFIGYEARVMQHEFDHLNGILFTDYLLQSNEELFIGARNQSQLELIDKNIAASF